MFVAIQDDEDFKLSGITYTDIRCVSSKYYFVVYSLSSFPLLGTTSISPCGRLQIKKTKTFWPPQRQKRALC